MQIVSTDLPRNRLGCRGKHECLCDYNARVVAKVSLCFEMTHEVYSVLV